MRSGFTSSTATIRPQQNPLVSLVAWLVDQTKGRWVFQRADITVGIAPQNVAFARRLGSHRTTYIPNAIEVERFKKVATDLRERLGIGPQEKIIVFAGRLIRMKGVNDLIEAMKGLNAHLLVVGDGPERTRLEEQAKANGVHAQFLGAQDEQGVIEALSIADLFVNPSYSEGLPTSILEAAAMESPHRDRTWGNEGNHHEEDGRQLIPAGDISALRTAIAQTLQDQATNEAWT